MVNTITIAMKRYMIGSRFLSNCTRKTASRIAEPIMVANTIVKNIVNRMRVGCFSEGLIFNKSVSML
tara:strand:- start:991 stop:1191 length:201 start_codon:yes stop_codon:yes gene_type:complete